MSTISPAIERRPTLQDRTLSGSPDVLRHAPPSPKRKSSESVLNHDGENDSSKKAKRRKVNHACVYCRRSHMTCDLERPCARCVKRDIGHLCHDEPREPPKRTKSELGLAELAPAPEEEQDIRHSIGSSGGLDAVHGALPPVYGGDMAGLNGSISAASTQPQQQPQLAQPKPLSPTLLQRSQHLTNNTNNMNTLAPSSTFDWNNNSVNGQFQDMHHLHPNYMFNTSEVTNEYNLLNDFLSNSLLDDGALYGSNDAAESLFNDPLLTTSSLSALTNNFQQLPPQPPLLPPPPLQQPQINQNAKAGEEISRPSSAFPISDKARDKFYMTAADPAGLDSAGSRLHKLLKAKYDAGMLKPFNYVKGYARLQSYMSRHLHPGSQRRILEQLSRFRPKFREAMHSLTDMQLVLVEMWFERSLMEYDRVFASMAIPACCWRRTGEIFRGNREMAELIGVPMDRLRDGKIAIHEIIAEDSLVSYWEKFGAIAFDQTQKAILTSCSLKRPAPEPGGGGDESAGNRSDAPTASEGKGTEKGEGVRCCFSFTIRRDTHNIPSLIVGNFLPIPPARSK
ncbi:hypothetical protein BAUCODRAFT_130166 [Baudoinia panamericana UAMH 10762]|uniref:Zn(2)-C6 fungal-type domain-containing protein n=1 Tax=Baudoinia panamericana (strain UAMH 10762) TaxID=717646 RepID=M2MP92_BAUPA|nr:uncharacterized protein BAUCODRAFT_130166 [Baudoinia panamericana UAMH 10762]EMC98521.1 hypothetical protein BAUCODRAFT_130166 [Baudoinia panamericana UAMH 10762]